MSNKDWRIGIDVGGTNTDAVVLDENLNLISAVKSPTTEDVMSARRTARTPSSSASVSIALL